MHVVRWNPMDEIDSVRRELDRAFGLTSDSTARSGSHLPASAVQIWETGDRYLVKMLVPGIDTDSLNIEASARQLTVSGTIQFAAPAEDAKLHVSEFGGGEFSRSFKLPTQVNVDAVSADYTHGVLTLTLPKDESSRTVKISINGSHQGTLSD